MSDSKKYFMPMIIIGILFFIYGFFTWLNGTLIPYLKIACQLESDFESFLVATAFFIAYTVMAIPSSFVHRKIGYKKGMALGLIIMALGSLLFIPAANARNFNMFLIGLFIIGTGLALLQTASNPYISLIGPIESAAKRISIMGIFNKCAGILAGLVFGYIALSDADGIEAKLAALDAAAKQEMLQELASRVILPYTIMAVILVAFAICIMLSSLPELKEEDDDMSSQNTISGKTSILQFPHVVLGALAIFLYVGVEVMAGDTIISYGKSLGFELSKARFFTQITLFFMLVGYVIGIFTIPKYFSQSFALRVCAILGVIFSFGAVVTNGFTSVLFIASLGLANSLMWPAIFPLAIDGLGRFTKSGSALLIMALAGGAILPLLYSKLSESTGTRLAYIIMVPCYLYILYFAVKGHKVGKPIAKH
ncbi:sugar MFS transporter [Ohtaekwangia koreensis]|uniref:Glucose/galactose transporter n=1 Tax=Ohtaekwangia koreensis TaxID=688867 RepID=A0A1T5LMM3_9BACT|nr:sugar MFS transporter [Ohtaekwangia koreensis]SKC77174.1 glucose/galactose transporter [Ohtaekwangia koreensis]